jgi:hypothetical protein
MSLWGQSGHGLLQRICLLLTQSGHDLGHNPLTAIKRPAILQP